MYGIIFTFKEAVNSVTSLMRKEAPHCGVSSLLKEALHHGNILLLNDRLPNADDVNILGGSIHTLK